MELLLHKPTVVVSAFDKKEIQVSSHPENMPFSFSVSFTGYGNIAPSTEGGKIFCILYAIFGIPLFGFLLAGVGDQLGTIFVKSIAKVEKMFRVSSQHTVIHSMNNMNNDDAILMYYKNYY
jgi:hypothetical protein